VTNKELRMLDGEVHEKVMGHAKTCLHLSVTRPDPDSSLMVCDSCKREFGSTGLAMEQFRVPFYSTDIAAAWLILVAWKGDFELRRQSGIVWKCELFRPSEEFAIWDDTPMLAICRAALAAAARDEESQ
jgi:hypothetical protein